MKKLTAALVLPVFVCNCWPAWTMLTLLSDVRSRRVLPYFTNLCINLRPLLVALPILALACVLWLWFRRKERDAAWTGLIVTTTTLLLVFVFPAMLTSCWLFVGPMKSLQ